MEPVHIALIAIITTLSTGLIKLMEILIKKRPNGSNKMAEISEKVVENSTEIKNFKINLADIKIDLQRAIDKIDKFNEH